MFATHIFAIIASLCVVALADEQAFAWVLGRKPILNARLITFYHVLTWAGLLVITVSGTMLALPQLSYLLTQPLFIMKMLFVLVLFLNAILIGRLSHVATARSFASITWSEAIPLFVSGALSSFSWAGALIVALILFG
jgi:hypothetical protein